MKGTLHKTEKGWVVEYAKHAELPLHPDYVKYYFLDEDAEGGEVEFEIVKEYIDSHTNQVQKYAKLINQVRKMVEDDVYEMAQIYALESGSLNKESRRKGFVDGYNKAKETLYTEEQVREAIRMSRVTNTTNVIGGGVKLHTYSDNEIIQSLKQPKK